jgi:hypothetical protein
MPLHVLSSLNGESARDGELHDNEIVVGFVGTGGAEEQDRRLVLPVLRVCRVVCFVWPGPVRTAAQRAELLRRIAGLTLASEQMNQKQGQDVQLGYTGSGRDNTLGHFHLVLESSKSDGTSLTAEEAYQALFSNRNPNMPDSENNDDLQHSQLILQLWESVSVWTLATGISSTGNHVSGGRGEDYTLTALSAADKQQILRLRVGNIYTP